MILRIKPIIHLLTKRIHDMDNLIFRKCALEKFDFLISQYGFKCKQVDLYYLRFESNTVFAEVHYDSQRSFEIDFSIGLLGDLYDGKERPFYLNELVKFADPKNKEDYKLIQANTPEEIIRLVPKIANLVEKYAKDFLSGNKSRFKTLSDFRENECNKYALEIELKGIREAAQRAWEQKDYACIVKLYEPVKDRITQSEYKKLEYSRKHL